MDSNAMPTPPSRESTCRVDPGHYQSPQAIFWAAVAWRDADALALAVERGADVDRLDHRGTTASWSLAVGGHSEWLSLLLAHGADPLWATSGGATLCWAALSDCLTKPRRQALDCLEALIAAGADPWQPDSRGQDALWLAVLLDDMDAARLLLEHSADGSRRPRPNALELALLLAAERKRPHLIELLLSHGADPDARQPKGWGAPHRDGNTPLQLAILHDCVASVDLLMAAGARHELPLRMDAYGGGFAGADFDALSLAAILGHERCAGAIESFVERRALAEASAQARQSSTGGRI